MSSSCTDIQLALAQYGSGELSPTESSVVEAHLVHCSACRQEMERETRLREMLSGLPMQSSTAAGSKNGAEIREIAGQMDNGATGFMAGFQRRRTAMIAGLAAAGIAAGIAMIVGTGSLPTGTGGPSDSSANLAGNNAPNWTSGELDLAQNQVAYSLALTARIIKKSEENAVRQVFGQKLPDVISDSLHKAINTNQGDQG